MNDATRRALKSTAKRLRLNELFWYAQRLLEDPSAISGPGTVVGTFEDSTGASIALLAEHRDRVVPGWRGMVNPPPMAPLPSPAEAQAKIDAMLTRLRRLDAMLRPWACSLRGADVVEVGAHDGATAYALAASGARSVVATDVAAYYITQRNEGAVTDEGKTAKNGELARLREIHRAAVDAAMAARVSFLEDDICASRLPDESADAILTLEVLEHILEPAEAFRSMARILRPGGFALHEYNPFFSLNGGHSLCTLDFPWGHARLDEPDVERYITQGRPAERVAALSFYHHNLNRMTLAQLHGAVASSGLELAGLVPWASEAHLGLLTPDALSQCLRNYPDIQILDLISPTVWLLVRKVQ